MIETTFAKDPAKNAVDAHVEIHKRLRDGDLVTPDNAREFVAGIFAADRYDLSKVGRFRFNKRFSKDMSHKELERKTISADDFATVLTHIITLNNDPDAMEDDIDHLGSRRVRYVGELLQAETPRRSFADETKYSRQNVHHRAGRHDAGVISFLLDRSRPDSRNSL